MFGAVSVLCSAALVAVAVAVVAVAVVAVAVVMAVAVVVTVWLLAFVLLMQLLLSSRLSALLVFCICCLSPFAAVGAFVCSVFFVASFAFAGALVLSQMLAARSQLLVSFFALRRCWRRSCKVRSLVVEGMLIAVILSAFRPGEAFHPPRAPPAPQDRSVVGVVAVASDAVVAVVIVVVTGVGIGVGVAGVAGVAGAAGAAGAAVVVGIVSYPPQSLQSP